MIQTNFTEKQIKQSLSACADFLCSKCDYYQYDDPTREHPLRCIHLLVVDANRLLKGEDE